MSESGIGQLVVTVGKNALPAAVAARFLIEELKPSNVLLVHTPESQREAQSISDFLAMKAGLDFAQVSSEPSNSQVDDLAGKIKEPNHFHFTGGTAAMFQTVQSRRKKAGDTSYLSLRTHGLLNEKGDPVVGGAGDLRKHFDLTVEQVAKLNGWSVATHNSDGPITAVTERFREVSRKIEPFRAGMSFGKNSRATESGSDKHTSATWEKGGLEEIEALRSVLGGRFLGGGPIEEEFKRNDPDYWNLHHFYNSGWFEFRVLDALEEAIGGNEHSGKIKTIKTNTYWTQKRGGRIKENKDTFETDIAFVYGYQLVLVSCTTGKDAKMKAFEALHRARQLGGDGARAIVISGLDGHSADLDQESLYLDIGLGSATTGGEKKHRSVEIWGKSPEDPSFKQRLTEYLEQLLGTGGREK